ncbi:MAG: restriction endonuclease [Bacteroidales bacterium]|nr:restriction endonuclease [Bacteroidales bacterium]
MNYFTEQSIKLANQQNYLDLLFPVYPLNPDIIREIDSTLWGAIEKSYNRNDNQALFRALLDLDLFPVKDGYVPFFRLDKSAIERNPDTINRICGRIREMGLDQLYERCTQPKETNRQMGQLFRQWIRRGVLGMGMVDVGNFSEGMNNVILDGSDNALMQFAQTNLGYTRDKGIDFIAYRNKQYVIGEAKFISDEGGHQNDQFLDAMTTLRSKVNENVQCVAILDGVLYIHSRKKMYRTITEGNLLVMSALLLRNYLYTL